MSAFLEKYEMVIGLEVHVQLKTRTKAFCSCSAAYGAPPNENTCPICLALPGTLPALNEQAVRLALRAANALGCTLNPRSIFARKNYFYPDLPKGFQMSQYDKPLAEHGKLEIWSERGTPSAIGITRVHLEEDSGKSVHDRYPAVTAIDLNRAGVPLIEIVSEPDMRSPFQAGEYLRELKLLLEYVDVSDANMEEGSLRVDANVSARVRGDAVLGTKTEVKNMNSISGVQQALAIEFERQCGVLERGDRVEQQTMLWDAARAEVRPARTKEGSHDYRYFPEPDLLPLVIPPDLLDSMRAQMRELPRAKRARFKADYGIDDAPPRPGEASRGASDAELLTATRERAHYFEAVVQAQKHGDPKSAANWMITELLAWANANGKRVSESKVTPPLLAALTDLVHDGTLSHTAANKVFAVLAVAGGDPRAIAERDGLVQERDAGALGQWVEEVLAENPAEAARYLGGEAKLQGVLVGLVMKKSKGRADPKQVNQLLASRASRGGG